jgi:iron complex transport system substrate-binding protein
VRIVSLLPSATEIVAALGGVGNLVGVTHACDHPPVIESRARVTSTAVDATATPAEIDAQVRTIMHQGLPLYALDEVMIRKLHPDLIFTQALCDVCAVVETDVIALAERLDPKPTVVSLSATSIEGVFTDIARAAAAMGLADEGDELLAGLRARVRAVHDTLKAAKAPRPRVAVIEWGEPVFAGGHWVPEMVHKAGGIDVLAKAGEHSQVVTIEAIVAADPDIVIIAPCGYALPEAVAEAERLLAHPAWSFLHTRPVWALDANGFASRPGPRLVDGIEVMARIFNADLFSPLDHSHAVPVMRPGAVAAG